MAKRWDAGWDAVDTLYTQWDTINRAARQERLAGLMPLTGFELKKSSYCLNKSGFEPVLLTQSGIRGYIRNAGKIGITELPYDTLSDEELTRSFKSWYEQE